MRRTKEFSGGPRRRFESVGVEQLVVLIENGLTCESTVLDIGCGALRAGRWLMPVLASGNYHGIEPNEAMLERGIEHCQAVVDEREPTFDTNDRFDFTVFGTKFTHFLARSIWTHASKPQIESMLDSATESGADDFRFVTSYRPVRWFSRDYRGEGWVGRSHRSSKRGLVRHSTEWIREACAARGLAVTESSRKPIGGQHWLIIGPQS